MNRDTRSFTTDLAIIGSGIAGFAASIFATNRGIPCALAGNTGAVAYTTGYLDLLGCLDAQTVRDPWSAIERLKKTSASHPLARLQRGEIEEAFAQFISFIGQCGIAYTAAGHVNLTALTPAGTLKPTFCVPATMAKGVEALRQKAPCTIIGFQGLKGFSAHQIQANLTDIWPGLQAKRVCFPGHERGELYAEVAARSLEVPHTRRLVAEIIRAEAAEAKFIGLPAVLGMHAPDAVHAELEELTGLSIFEIPTMPPAVPGIRLREMFEQVFPQKGITVIPQQKVQKITFNAADIALELTDNCGPIHISAKTAILATGRFLSGGLEASIDRISEPLIGLPISQPPSRQDWFHQQYMDTRGHAVHLAGIETDDRFRPLDTGGRIFDKRLFAAGIILAHQDWIRQRCGAGLAIATAYKAVEAVQDLLNS